MKANCLFLAARLVQAPTHTNLHIRDGRQGKAKSPKASGRAFQLTIEEAKATPDVVTGMCLFIFPLSLFSVCLYLCFC